MNYRHTIAISTLALTLVMPFCAGAETYEIQPMVPVSDSIRFTNENWLTLPHPEVANFSVLPDGTMHGSTVTGAEFFQYNVPNELGIRVQRFDIDDHSHFIIEGEVAYTFEDFSAKLAEAYLQKTNG